MKIIAFKGGTIGEEKELPLPLVLYPGHYGAFLGFKKNNNSKVFSVLAPKKQLKTI